MSDTEWQLVVTIFVLLSAHFLKIMFQALTVEWTKMTHYTERNCSNATAVCVISWLLNIQYYHTAFESLTTAIYAHRVWYCTELCLTIFGELAPVKGDWPLAKFRWHKLSYSYANLFEGQRIDQTNIQIYLDVKELTKQIFECIWIKEEPQI